MIKMLKLRRIQKKVGIHKLLYGNQLNKWDKVGMNMMNKELNKKKKKKNKKKMKKKKRKNNRKRLKN